MQQQLRVSGLLVVVEPVLDLLGYGKCPRRRLTNTRALQTTAALRRTAHRGLGAGIDTHGAAASTRVGLMPDPYRSEDDTARSRRDAKERLERVAADAASPIRRDLDARLQAAKRARSAVVRSEERSVRWTHRYSVLGPVVAQIEMGLWTVPFLAAGALAVGAFVGWPWWSVCGGAAVAPAVLWLLVAHALVARDLRWPSSLPFRVEGYREALGKASGTSSVLCVEIRLATETELPEQAYCERIFGAIAASVEVAGPVVRLKSPALPLTHLSSTIVEYGTQGVRLWLRTVVGEILVPFHQAFPIREVAVTLVG